MSRIAVIIEDDWELRGDGSGNVAAHQYLPARFLMDSAQELGLKLTFMVEVLQQLKFVEHSERSTDLRLQSRLWRDTVIEMHERGFDVQLHLHPQWRSASFAGHDAVVDGQWNIGRYGAKEQEEMVGTSLGYLTRLLAEHGAEHSVIAFKAGNWGMQPARTLLETLERHGIRWVMGVCKDLWVPQQGTDYRALEEDTLPYSPAPDDVCRKAAETGRLQIIPLAHASLGAHHVAAVVASRLAQRTAMRLLTSSPAEARRSGRGGQGGTQRRVRRGFGFANHVQLGNLPFSAMRAMFDSAYRRLNRVDADLVPMVIESHTKAFPGNYRNVARFLRYMVDRYGSRVEFHDISSFDRVMNAA